ncbi:hypothetical protein M378DRAFT_26618 [Amanita muscaria Koide BX008]|uniref:Uncharacterized protein n=1 Tax=Amanita muscaria (strain Koide BX008) TaxID=946122 RepID=A0A0C2T192_AMAMK|nr:hypothetical protein M378DRAFT_26618 [Amanita muscaria Koide BX008]
MLIESMRTFFDVLPKKSPNASNFWSQLAMHEAELVQPTASVETRFSAASSDSSSSSLFKEDEQNATKPLTKPRETCSSLTIRDTKVAEEAGLIHGPSELIVRDPGATPMTRPIPKIKPTTRGGVYTWNEKNEEGIVKIESNNEVVSPDMGNSSAISRSNSNSRCIDRGTFRGWYRRRPLWMIAVPHRAVSDCTPSPNVVLWTIHGVRWLLFDDDGWNFLIFASYTTWLRELESALG